MGLRLRLVTMDDCETMYQWRVADEEASPWFTGKTADWDLHQKWFAARVDNPCVRLWICERDGVAVGDARLDSNGEVTYNVLPEFHRQGIGSWILGEVNRLAVLEGWQRVRAVVDDTNTASIGCLEKAGFKFRADVFFYRWPE